MSVEGFHWEGFFRAIQGDLWGSASVIVFMVFAYVVIRFLVNKTDLFGNREKASVRKWSTVGLLVIIGIVLVSLFWRIASVASVNRVPRSDADKSGVYQQMDTASERSE